MSPRSRRIAAVVLLVLGAGSLPLFAKTPAGHGPAKSATPANEFPPGDGQEIAARSCTMCHSPMLATQQAKDSTGWEKTLSLMEKWGAPVKGAEHDTLRSYLIVHFGTHAEHSAE